ncbi:MAG: hypothetical protein EOP48_00115 [Sphingobacteriales bacterium]|nr:MAG: hypothetical protein EOP48_00115 [Sphingobacteriales bacterium]
MKIAVLIVAMNLIFNSGCGKKEESSKQVELRIKSEDLELVGMIKTLVADYNHGLGFDAIKTTTSTELGVSNLSFYKDGTAPAGHENALGTGQGKLIKTDENTKMNFSTFKYETSTKKQFVMNVSFDSEYFKSRSSKFDDKLSAEYTEVFRLFCHELGHGFGLSHNVNNRFDVMSPWTPLQERGDMAKYWGQINAQIGLEGR